MSKIGHIQGHFPNPINGVCLLLHFIFSNVNGFWDSIFGSKLFSAIEVMGCALMARKDGILCPIIHWWDAMYTLLKIIFCLRFLIAVSIIVIGFCLSYRRTMHLYGRIVWCIFINLRNFVGNNNTVKYWIYRYRFLLGSAEDTYTEYVNRKRLKESGTVR